MPSLAEPATSFHKLQESISAVSRSKMTASYFTQPPSGSSCLATHAVEQVEHALAPGVDRIVGFEQRKRAGNARPQEGAGQRIVGICRLLTTEKRLFLQHAPRWLEHRAEGGHAPLPRLGLEQREVGGA